jgi:hypothetical protein
VTKTEGKPRSGAKGQQSHDWECRAIGEKGYYHWHCKRCHASAPYPSPSGIHEGPCTGHQPAVKSTSHSEDQRPESEVGVTINEPTVKPGSRLPRGCPFYGSEDATK